MVDKCYQYCIMPLEVNLTGLVLLIYYGDILTLFIRNEIVFHLCYYIISLSSFQISLINIGLSLGHDNGSLHDSSNLDDSMIVKGSRHGSQDTPASPAPRRTVAAASVPVTPAKLIKENSTDGLIPVGGLTPATPPPPPPGIPYNSVAAGRVASTNVTPSTAKNTAGIVAAKSNPVPIGGLISLVTTTSTQSNSNDENRSPVISAQNEVTVCATVNATVMKSDEVVVSAESAPISSSQAAMTPSGAVHLSHHSHANGPSAQEVVLMACGALVIVISVFFKICNYICLFQFQLNLLKIKLCECCVFLNKINNQLVQNHNG
uniref:Flocculation protein FLO11-like n=1 Tax=Heterorhabditis bacteriophora TaxID=37862 RepID=A0A1I7W9R4_HETBA